MTTNPEIVPAWQVSVQVDGVDRGVATPNLTRGEALQLAHEMNESVHPLLIAQPWMPTIIAIPAPEEPGRQVFREMMKDLDELVPKLQPLPEMKPIIGPTLDRVIGHWVEVRNGMENQWAGFVVSGLDAPSVMIESIQGRRMMQPLSSITEVSDEVVDLEALRLGRVAPK